jgi:hypothetical protein
MFPIFSERMRAELEASGAVPAAKGVTDGVGAAPAARVAAPSGPAAAPVPPPAARAVPEKPEALDAAALGARVARRSAARLVRQPSFWAVLLLVAAGIAYLLLQRSSSGP